LLEVLEVEVVVTVPAVRVAVAVQVEDTQKSLLPQQLLPMPM
tara:strand:+ start:223 stop:348 length:126 start_codon:yes stop_codon:yes gene_type:complete